MAMTVEQIVWAGTGIMLSMVAFFLVAFYKQVIRIGDDIQQVRISQAANTEKIKSIEKRVDFFERFLDQNFKQKTNVA